MKRLFLCVLIIIFFEFKNSKVFASDICTEARVGINLAGAEFGQNIPGREGYDYSFPSALQISYFTKVGFRSIRLPIMWERLQPMLNGPLDQKYLAGIISVLDNAKENDVDVLVDLHNYDRYNKEIVGTQNVPPASFYDVWHKLASALHTHKALYAYGLMNEPFKTGELWHQTAQFGVDGIRSVDHEHRIFIAGEGFSSALMWEKLNPKPFIHDPMNLEVYEAHLYLDQSGGGQYDSTVPYKDPISVIDERIQPFLSWVSLNGVRGAIGEWGVPNDDDRWFGAVDHVLEIAKAHCLRTYYWAGGNWSPGYKLSLRPMNGDGAERLLTKHFSILLSKRKD